MKSLAKTFVCILPGSMALSYYHTASTVGEFLAMIGIILLLFGGGGLREYWED